VFRVVLVGYFCSASVKTQLPRSCRVILLLDLAGEVGEADRLKSNCDRGYRVEDGIITNVVVPRSVHDCFSHHTCQGAGGLVGCRIRVAAN